MNAQLRAFSDPTRMHILMLVREKELSAGAISSHFSISRPGVSQHLTILKAASLLKERREGTSRYYSIDPAGFSILRDALEGFWQERPQQVYALQG
jgi:DNA-binding transcriptional ArsR family regulator